jgi:hypothetical protein
VTLAKILLKLWRLRLWVGLGILLGGVAAVGSITTSHSTVYASASTEMLVDSPDSALANASIDLAGYNARATVFARLMTSAEALQYIGKAAGINGNLIAADGPIEINGEPTATHAPVAISGGNDLPAPAIYKLDFLQNPSLPTVQVFADAPTTAQAIALANGAVTGFANFINQLNANNVPQSQRIEVRQLGRASGGMVDATASKKIALLVFIAVFAVWCWIVLFASRLRGNLRAAKRGGVDDLYDVPQDPFPAIATSAAGDSVPGFTTDSVPGFTTDSVPGFTTDSVPGFTTDSVPGFTTPPDRLNGDEVETNAGVNGGLSHRAWATSRVKSRP